MKLFPLSGISLLMELVVIHATAKYKSQGVAFLTSHVHFSLWTPVFVRGISSPLTGFEQFCLLLIQSFSPLVRTTNFLKYFLLGTWEGLHFHSFFLF